MIVSIRAVLAGALLLSPAMARAASPVACADDEYAQTRSAWVGQRLDSPGIVATPEGFLVSWFGESWETISVEGETVGARSAIPEAAWRPTTVASGPHVRLVVGDGIYGYVGQRLAMDGTPVGAPLYFGDASWGQHVTAAFDGANFVVAWTNPDPTGESEYDVKAMIVEPDGVVRAPAVLAKTHGSHALHSVRTGDVTWVVWNGSPSTDVGGVFGVRLDAAGAPLDRLPVALSKGSHVLATTSLGDDALIAVMGFYDQREVVPLNASGAGPAVDVTALGFNSVVSVTGDPRGDGYLLWTSSDRNGPDPFTSTTITGHALDHDGAPLQAATFATLRGAWAAVAFDGHELRYVATEESAPEGSSRVRTGRISDTGVVDPGAVLATEDFRHDTWVECVPRGVPYEPSDDSYDSYDGCGSCQVAPGATSAALVLIAALVAVLPRRRRR